MSWRTLRKAETTEKGRFAVGRRDFLKLATAALAGAGIGVGF